MNSTKTRLLAVAAALVTMQACQKEYNSGTPINTTGTDKTKLNQLFAGLRTAPQVFTVSAGAYQQKQGTAGTQLAFRPNSFKDANGNVITSGTVRLEMVEMYNPGQMIANRATTTANGALLRSGGQIHISATMNGQEVFANNYGISFPQSEPSTQPMALYYGDTNNPDSVTTWTLADTTRTGTTSNGTAADSAAVTQYAYHFDSCNHFQWINCDHFYGSTSPLTDISVIVPDTSYNSSNTQVDVVFPTINCVTAMSQYAAATHTFDLASNYKVPVGESIDICVITNRNGAYYYYAQVGLTVTDGMVLSAYMQPVTMEAVLAALATLQ